MSNTEHYEFEAKVKRHIKELPEQTVKARLADFVDVAPVETVKLLAAALGVKTIPL